MQIAAHLATQTNLHNHPLYHLLCSIAELQQPVLLLSVYAKEETNCPGLKMLKTSFIQDHLPWAGLLNRAKFKKILRQFPAQVLITESPADADLVNIPVAIFITEMVKVGKYFLVNHQKISALKLKVFLNLANHIVCIDAYVQQAIVQYFPETKQKICVSGWPLKSITAAYIAQENMTLSSPHFLSFLSASPENNLLVLKAFSLFKKRMKSAAKMYFLHRESEDTGRVLPGLASYKYRNDVAFAPVNSHPLSEPSIAAFCFDNDAKANYFKLIMLQSGNPLCVVDNAANHFLLGDAALYTKPEPLETSTVMINMYQYEATAGILKQHANAVLQQHDEAEVATKLKALLHLN